MSNSTEDEKTTVAPEEPEEGVDASQDIVAEEDLDSEGEDHVADETRYFLMSRPIKPRQRDMPDKSNRGPLHLFLDIGGELPKAGARPGMEILRGNPE